MKAEDKNLTDSLKKAINKLQDGECALVVINGEQEISSALTGLTPLIDIVKNTPQILRGAFVADKIVGKAAALLLSFTGVRAVYAGILSDCAVPVLEGAGISYYYNKKVPFIKNRAGNDTCPMEKRVQDIDDPAAGAALLLNLEIPHIKDMPA